MMTGFVLIFLFFTTTLNVIASPVTIISYLNNKIETIRCKQAGRTNVRTKRCGSEKCPPPIMTLRSKV